VTIDAPIKLIRQIVILCDGTRSEEQVVKALDKEWDGEVVSELLNELRHQKVLVHAHQFGEEMWKIAQNPPPFPNYVSDADALKLEEQAAQRILNDKSEMLYQAKVGELGSLLLKRESVRSFSGESVNFQSIINMLWAAYGRQGSGGPHKTVPSAGALYPLLIHVALFQSTGDLQPGLYRVSFGHVGAVGFHPISGDTDRLSRAFYNPLRLEKTHGVIVISGSFRITGQKYGNRSLLYVPLEAGHAAQNIHLVAVEQGLATLEMGGFSDILLGQAIDLPKQYQPLIAVVFGQKANDDQSEDGKANIEIQWAIPANESYRPQFAIASARISEKLGWAHGRDPSPRLAAVKAEAEAREWAACGGVPADLVRAKFSDLENALDPREVIKYHPSQYRIKEFPFEPFDEGTEYEWTEARDEITGAAVNVLADLVYFPYYPRTPYYAYANSSGVAAHPERQKAVETSTLELVERDSFTIAYLTRFQFPTVVERTVPDEIRGRIRELRRAGFKVWIKDHSIDLAPVACVVAQSEEFTYTPCASCSSFEFEYALSHALMEVEAMVLDRLENGPAKPIKPREVNWPLDHGRLYGQPQYFRRADFLIKGHETSFRDGGKHMARSWQELVDRLQAKGWNLFTIPLYLSEEYGGNSGLHIIRSIVPGMVPMTFGYRQEAGGMDRIYEVADKFRRKNVSYGDLTKFPHPFA
jgi:thiazole/oxazole-forming peptide maturase SagD family component